MRAANDVANPARIAAAADLFALAASRGELLGEALRAQLRPPAGGFSSSAGGLVADASADAGDDALSVEMGDEAASVSARAGKTGDMRAAVTARAAAGRGGEMSGT
jgi:hypothetical protein